MGFSEQSHFESNHARKLLVADDHLLVAQGIERLLLENFGSVNVVQSGEALVEAIRREPPDLVIADISMSGCSGIDAMRTLQKEGCKIPFIFLTMHSDSAMAAEAIRAGARGYLVKSSAGEELVRAIREVFNGNTYVTPTLAVSAILCFDRRQYKLTDKQHRILDYVARGMRSKQIAFELGVSLRTVESHKYAIMQELGVHGTVELVQKMKTEGLIRA